MISELEFSPAVWNVLTPEYRDQVKKSTASEQKDVATVLHCLQYISKLLDVNNILTICGKAVPLKMQQIVLVYIFVIPRFALE